MEDEVDFAIDRSSSTMEPMHGDVHLQMRHGALQSPAAPAWGESLIYASAKGGLTGRDIML